MRCEKNKGKIFFIIWAIILLISTAFLPICLSDFILPPLGGGMVHCDPQMTENLWLPPPTENVSTVWYRHELGGEKWGTWWNGIVGNGKIAAMTFNNLSFMFNNNFGHNNLMIYDYYGNRIWSDNQTLNPTAATSSPMVDIYDRVVACDNETIILVNASDHNNVYVEWNSSYDLGSFWKPFMVTPVCPTIVENRTIVLPISNGPLLAFDVQTGEKIAELMLGQNETIDPYWGLPEMNSSNYKIIRQNYYFYSVCPYRYNSSSHLIEWNSSIPYGIMPFKFHIFIDNNITFFVNENYVIAYEQNGLLDWTHLAENTIDNGGIYTGEGYFSSINSICAKGNRIFIATQYTKPGTRPVNNTVGRLYAIDIDPDAENKLIVQWNYTYFGSSQASPTVISDTVYFDGYNDTKIPETRDPHIYALYMNGTEKWKISYPNMTWFTFTKDPRGGFWYEDCDQWRTINSGGNKLVRFYEENGTEMKGEEIDMKTLLNDTGFYGEFPVIPSSDMTICGTPTYLIMLISANHQWFKQGKWVVAINLSDNNSVLWKVPLNATLLSNLNYANGDYTILTENNQSRVLFGTWLGGVMAIGSRSNSWFQDINYQLKDSYVDSNSDSDSIQVNYTIKTTLPDRVLVKASLISMQHPILCRYKAERYYNISSSAGIDSNLNISLPVQAPEGYYILRVLLYNSSGETMRDLLNIPDFMDFGIFSDDLFISDNPFYLSPPNDLPETPHQPTGNNTIENGPNYAYTTNTTDPNGDTIWYQWRWETPLGTDRYTPWILGGPYESGENCTREINWWFPGTYEIQVRAKDRLISPDATDWSEPLTVTVSNSEGGEFPWNTELLGQFSSTVLTIDQETSCNGLTTGVTVNTQTKGSLNWTWSFGDGSISYEQNITHNYDQLGTYKVNLTIRNSEGNTYNCTTNVSVVVLRSDFNTTGSAQPNETLYFHDISQGVYNIVNWTWNFSDENFSYAQNTSHIFNVTGEYNVTLTTKDSQDNIHVFNQIITVETTPPQFVSVIDTPDPVPRGYPLLISADFFDNQSGIQDVYINITYPDNTTQNDTMKINVSNPYDYEYNFNNTWQIGIYNYSIWLDDTANNTNFTIGFNFSVIPTPAISFEEPPTPTNNTVQQINWTQVNIAVYDTENTSAFIDWNHSLKGYWPMESYNDTGVYDNSTNENFGTFQNGLNNRNIIPGKYGDGLEFDGSDDYLDVGTSNSLDLGTGDFTFMVWEKSHTTLYSKKAMILTNNPAMQSWKGYGFGVINSPYLIVSQSTGNNITLQGATDVTDNTWHQIAYICRSGEYSIYVDGEEDANNGGIAAKNITNTQQTMIAYDGHLSSWCYFDGVLDEPQLYNRALGWDEINASYNNGINRLYHNFTSLSDGTYSYYAYAIDTTGNQSSTETRQILIDTTPPTITDVTASPHTVGFGYNVTITADVVDNGSGIDLVTIQIIPPGGAGNSSNYTMALVSNNTYQYVFTDTWSTGQYNYTIWATDNTNNTASSSAHHFHVLAEATISVATLRNTYSGSQYINITDPPNPPENYTLVDRGLTWNTYYNATSGENILETYQGPVNYQEENETWTPINTTLNQLDPNHPGYVYGYRTGNDHGLYGVYFKSNAQQEWPVAFTFNRSDDPTIHAIRSKLVGVGYVDPQSNWAYQYLQNVQSSQGQTNEYFITYPGVFTGTDVTWSYGNTGLKEEITMSNATKTVLQNHPPSQYGLNDASSYLVFITKLDHQDLNLYNNSGLLDGNVTISDTGVEFKDTLGQFKCALPLGEAYELNNETARQTADLPYHPPEWEHLPALRIEAH